MRKAAHEKSELSPNEESRLQENREDSETKVLSILAEK